MTKRRAPKPGARRRVRRTSRGRAAPPPPPRPFGWRGAGGAPETPVPPVEQRDPTQDQDREDPPT